MQSCFIIIHESGRRSKSCVRPRKKEERRKEEKKEKDVRENRSAAAKGTMNQTVPCALVALSPVETTGASVPMYSPVSAPSTVAMPMETPFMGLVY